LSISTRTRHRRQEKDFQDLSNTPLINENLNISDDSIRTYNRLEITNHIPNFSLPISVNPSIIASNVQEDNNKLELENFRKRVEEHDRSKYEI
jgi:hypothetical protein